MPCYSGPSIKYRNVEVSKKEDAEQIAKLEASLCGSHTRVY